MSAVGTDVRTVLMFGIYAFVYLIPKNTFIPLGICPSLVPTPSITSHLIKEFVCGNIECLFVFVSRNGRACHHRVAGKSLQQAACASAPILQDRIWKGNRPDVGIL